MCDCWINGFVCFGAGIIISILTYYIYNSKSQK